MISHRKDFALTMTGDTITDTDSQNLKPLILETYSRRFQAVNNLYSILYKHYLDHFSQR